MPFLKITTSAALDPENQSHILKTFSDLVRDDLGKPEQYVMVGIEPGNLMMSGEAGPAAWVELRSLGGLDPDINKALSATICQTLEQHLGVSPQRVFINFCQPERSDWGWNGDTFG